MEMNSWIKATDEALAKVVHRCAELTGRIAIQEVVMTVFLAQTNAATADVVRRSMDEAMRDMRNSDADTPTLEGALAAVRRVQQSLPP